MDDGHELAMSLRGAYLALHRRANAELSGFGLTADQFVLLTALAQAEAVNQADLVRRTGSDPNTLSAMLARLERRGLVLRERHATDGRARRVALTDEGRRAQGAAWRGSVAFREGLVASLSPEVRETLVGHLGRLARLWNEPEPGVET